ncbi:MAG: hypothetical protein HY364_04255 [Candidatus Aenigmarchaeota archaeon]|nr:hypothetical protein [Candidatus Aenigmarchaeota archaeon]
MADDVVIRFYFDPIRISKDFVRNLISSIHGTTYEDVGYSTKAKENKNGEFIAKRKQNAPIDEAIEWVSREGGIIYRLNYKNFIHFDLKICFQASTKRKLAIIEVSFIGANFNEEEEKRFERGAVLIELSKNIWNAMKQKPLYGMGDDGGFVDYGPSSEDILRLNIEDKINIYWLNFYGQELISKFGKENIQKILPYPKAKRPFWKIEELDDGILTIQAPLPRVYMSKEEDR